MDDRERVGREASSTAVVLDSHRQAQDEGVKTTESGGTSGLNHAGKKSLPPRRRG